MNYKKIADKAYSKIRQYGSECIIKRVTGSVYNPVTNKYEGAEDDVKGYALQSSFNMENIDGTNIKAGDILLMCVFDKEPKINETVLFGGNQYKIISLASVNPDGKNVMYYKAQCR